MEAPTAGIKPWAAWTARCLIQYTMKGIQGCLKTNIYSKFSKFQRACRKLTGLLE